MGRTGRIKPESNGIAPMSTRLVSAVAKFAIAAPRSSFPESGPDEYYWVDLVGCEVIGQQGAILGRVVAIEDFGAPHPVLRVGGADGASHLIPFTAPIIGDVDLTAKRIDADWAADY